MDFEKLEDDEKNRYYILAKEILAGHLYCTRAWSAWSYKTMTENDFFESCEDEIALENSAKLIYQFLETRFREMKINDFLNEN